MDYVEILLQNFICIHYQNTNRIEEPVYSLKSFSVVKCLLYESNFNNFEVMKSFSFYIHCNYCSENRNVVIL